MNRNSVDPETRKMPGIVQRIKRALGVTAVEKTQAVEFRPAVDEFIKGRMSLTEYAQRNARQSGMSDAKSAALLKRVRNLNEAYDGWIAGRHRRYVGAEITDQPDSTQYGFSRERLRTIFEWNMDETSQATSEGLLYLLDATPLGEPKRFEAGGRVTARQEYSSSTGLNFIDVRNIAPSDSSQISYHQLYVYLPQKD